MNGAQSPERLGTDIAALSAGVVAVCVTLFLGPGTYDFLNFIVSLTLLAVIAGYVLPSPRRFMQSLAVAASIGLAAIPAIGFFIEAPASPHPLGVLTATYGPECNKDGYECDGGKARPKVNGAQIFLSWMFVLFVTCSIDRVWQNRCPSGT
jgi:hypothetical protein